MAENETVKPGHAQGQSQDPYLADAASAAQLGPAPAAN